MSRCNSLWIGLCCSTVIWTVGGSARAWTDAPLCSVRGYEALNTLRSTDAQELVTPDMLGPEEAASDSPHWGGEADVCVDPLPGPAPLPDGAPNALDRLDRTGPAWTKPLELDDAREALLKAEALRAQGKLDDALLHLRIVERAMPRIADRIALMRGDLLRELYMPKQACAAYAQARKSLDRNVVARARVGGVYCLLEAADRKGESELQALLRRYPHLTEREQLRYELALARKAKGNRWGAAALLRSIDVQYPASPVAALARRELESMRAAGVRVRPLTPTEKVERAERMLRWAPLEDTQTQVEELQADRRLAPPLRARVHVLAAKLARMRGDWEELDETIDAARRKGVAVPGVGRLINAAVDPEGDALRKAGDKRVRAITRGRPMYRLRNQQLRAVVDLAARYNLREVADSAVEVMAKRRKISPAALFDTAIRLTGLASDENLARLLEDVAAVRRYRVSGGYHYARALERLGRYDEARALYDRVEQQDRSRTGYYAMWAGLRKWAMLSAQQQSCVPTGGPGADSSTDSKLDPPEVLKRDAPARNAKSAPSLSPNIAALLAVGANIPMVGPPLPERLAEESLRERIAELLTPVVEAHGEAYPWLARALDLVHLQQFDAAADELNEVYMAYRDAKGSPRLRAGVQAVFTGNAPPRWPADYRLRRERLSLARDDASRKALEQATILLGDPGVGLRFGDFTLGERPRAYEEHVNRIARKYGLDPNLLFAVMRVESIYNRRIVSNAGAVGLMQIMPATGKRIADQLGYEGFETTDLLDPRTNLEFSAWYLASLIERFDGRLPLAIASYNGGPHNVRLWMRENPQDMPLDVFLERIPFSQTHRYVRRVLTHYAAYRAQQNLPMTRLNVTLPKPEPDALGF